MGIETKHESRPAKQQAIEYELFMAHPVRQLVGGWVLRIRDREPAIESRNFTSWEFEGKYGDRWVIKIETRLARRFGLTGGVPIQEVPETADEHESAEQLALRSAAGEAVGRICDKERDCMPTQFAERDLVIAQLREFISAADIVRAERGTRTDSDLYHRTSVFLRDEKLFLKEEVLERLCATPLIRDQVTKELLQRQDMIPGTKGIATQRPRIGGSVAVERIRYYCFPESFAK